MFSSIFLRIVVFLFWLTPFPVLYLLSDLLAFLLQHVIGYRKAVILDNLKQAFPEKNDGEIQGIVRKTYKNLTDITLETIKSYTTSLSEIRRRCKVRNPEIVMEQLAQGRSVILAGSHIGNWEYGGITLPEGLHNRLFGVYKPMTNKIINAYANEKRERGGIVTVAMEDVLSVMRKQKGKEAMAYMLIADQSPSSRKRAHWVTFFGRETASLPGVDVLSRTFDCPVFYYKILRIRRGFYEIEYSPLWLDPQQGTEGDITRAYTARLEDEIRACPEHWLWSHKRWKMKRAE